jgi:hypothetical protein
MRPAMPCVLCTLCRVLLSAVCRQGPLLWHIIYRVSPRTSPVAAKSVVCHVGTDHGRGYVCRVPGESGTRQTFWPRQKLVFR